MTDRPTAAIFDLDGTLLDTLDDIAAAVNAVLGPRYGLTHPVGAVRRFVGSGVRTLFARALAGRDPSAADLDACVAGFHETYAKTWDATTGPYEGVPELLAALAEGGVALAVLSNKPDDFTKDCVARYFPAIPWRAVIGQRAGVPVKPDPTALREILRGLPGRAARGGDAVAYVGDSDVDMQTGRAGGLLTIGVTWGYRDPEELTAAGADRLVDRADGLRPIFFGAD